MNKNECQALLSNVIIINTSSYYKGHNTTENSKIASGRIVLMISRQKRTIKNEEDPKRMKWGRLISEMCVHSKPSHLASQQMNHNDSKGLYYSMGNNGIFKRVGNSTVGWYEPLKKDNDKM